MTSQNKKEMIYDGINYKWIGIPQEIENFLMK